jgi:hypothetical protein
MGTNGGSRAAAEKIRAAEELRDELREALAAVGIKLPSLGIEALGYADPDPFLLMELGRCNLVTARALLDVVRDAAGRAS